MSDPYLSKISVEGVSDAMPRVKISLFAPTGGGKTSLILAFIATLQGHPELQLQPAKCKTHSKEKSLGGDSTDANKPYDSTEEESLGGDSTGAHKPYDPTEEESPGGDSTGAHKPYDPTKKESPGGGDTTDCVGKVCDSWVLINQADEPKRYEQAMNADYSGMSRTTDTTLSIGYWRYVLKEISHTSGRINRICLEFLDYPGDWAVAYNARIDQKPNQGDENWTKKLCGAIANSSAFIILLDAPFFIYPVGGRESPSLYGIRNLFRAIEKNRDNQSPIAFCLNRFDSNVLFDIYSHSREGRQTFTDYFLKKTQNQIQECTKTEKVREFIINRYNYSHRMALIPVACYNAAYIENSREFADARAKLLPGICVDESFFKEREINDRISYDGHPWHGEPNNEGNWKNDVKCISHKGCYLEVPSPDTEGNQKDHHPDCVGGFNWNHLESVSSTGVFTKLPSTEEGGDRISLSLSGELTEQLKQQQRTGSGRDMHFFQNPWNADGLFFWILYQVLDEHYLETLTNEHLNAHCNLKKGIEKICCDLEKEIKKTCSEIKEKKKSKPKWTKRGGYSKELKDLKKRESDIKKILTACEKIKNLNELPENNTKENLAAYKKLKDILTETPQKECGDNCGKLYKTLEELRKNEYNGRKNLEIYERGTFNARTSRFSFFRKNTRMPSSEHQEGLLKISKENYPKGTIYEINVETNPVEPNKIVFSKCKE